MESSDVLAWASPIIGLLCAWFLQRLIKDYDDFKKSITHDMDKLGASHRASVDKVVTASNELKDKINDLKLIQATYQQETKTAVFKNSIHLEQAEKLLSLIEIKIKSVNDELTTAHAKIKDVQGFSFKVLEYLKELRKQTDKQDEEIKTIKIQLSEDLIMFKTQKKTQS